MSNLMQSPAEQSVLLDYGCGSGSWLSLFKAMGVPWRLIGTDVTPHAIDILKQAGIEGHVAK